MRPRRLTARRGRPRLPAKTIPGKRPRYFAFRCPAPRRRPRSDVWEGTAMNLVPTTPPAEPASEVLRVLEDYLERLERGEAVTPEELLAQRPELAEPLRACL